MTRGTVRAIGAATTQTTTTYPTPGDAATFADQTNTFWTQLEASMLTCGAQGKLDAETQAEFVQDLTTWSSFYAGRSGTFGGLAMWWGFDTISEYQAKGATWYNKIQAACPGASLPALPQKATPELDWIAKLVAAAPWVVGGAVLIGGVWYAWPWLSALRTAGPRKNPSRRRKRR